MTEEIPSRVSADNACQNAQKNSDEQNARIEHDQALSRVMTAVVNDDAQLFKQFVDNDAFRRWLTDTVFRLAYQPPSQGAYHQARPAGRTRPALRTSGSAAARAFELSRWRGGRYASS
jgi:hypothetical protein